MMLDIADNRRTNISGLIIRFVIIITMIIQVLLIIHIINTGTTEDKAIITMSSGLLFLWVIVIGSMIYIFKNRIKILFTSSNLYVLKFFLLAVVMCMIEEAIATTMTNTALLWGLSPNEVFITASPNYLEVITRHSLIVFVPQFLLWGYVLSKYYFAPNSVLILYGITGYLSEVIAFGISSNVISIGFWIMVYGLIVYLPAYCLPRKALIAKPHPLFFPLMIILPLIITMLWIIILKSINIL